MEKNVNEEGYEVLVTGLVQGVGFRYFTCKEAKSLGIGGYAKNLYDGTVQIQMFGRHKQLLKLLKWLEIGPKTSVIDTIAVNKIAYRQEDRFISL